MNEIKYAFEVLPSDSIVLYTNYREVYLGDAAFEPIMAELNRRKAVVFVHPTICQCSIGLLPGVPVSVIEFPHDTTRTITSMLFHGTFEPYPKIRFIFSHAGGTVWFEGVGAERPSRRCFGLILFRRCRCRRGHLLILASCV